MLCKKVPLRVVISFPNHDQEKGNKDVLNQFQPLKLNVQVIQKNPQEFCKEYFQTAKSQCTSCQKDPQEFCEEYFQTAKNQCTSRQKEPPRVLRGIFSNR
jgi:hypothetical protein